MNQYRQLSLFDVMPDDGFKTDPDCDWCGCCHKWHEPMGDYWFHTPEEATTAWNAHKGEEVSMYEECSSLREIKQDAQTTWYITNIEAPIRDLVKLIRDNGFNTTCSCGHRKYVECDLSLDGEMKRLHDILFNEGYENYTLTYQVKVVRGICMIKNVTIQL